MLSSWSVVITTSAQNDLQEIYRYIALEDERTAYEFIMAITGQIFNLADIKHPGVPRGWVSPGLRMFPFKKRCIYFRLIKNDLIVIRVLHEKKDVSSSFHSS
ncbi:MAG: type II toxin-antitoxin system RelE/ParE family toxin [Bacteroidota bacterium]